MHIDIYYLSITIYIHIYIYIGVVHSGEGIFCCRSHNAKLFERIEHSGSRQAIKNVNKRTLLVLLLLQLLLVLHKALKFP